jgi:YYY domain-containing protein
MVAQFLAWYLVVQLITVLSLPLAATLFVNLPDRGYAFAKSLGILLVGVLLWLGTSYGLLRNEMGGAWLALLLVALCSFVVGREVPFDKLRASGVWGEGRNLAFRFPRVPFGRAPLTLRYVLVIELLFLLAFAAWAVVRAYDPAAHHTEKPMDLMFMNSIWVSPTYPPRDAWLSGYAISYYYLGYWLLTTLGWLAGQPPAIAYTLGQACWFGLLLIGSFGVVYNLLRHAGEPERRSLFGGLLGAVAVGVTGNLQVLFEWLYANGVDATGVARWFDVHNFPENAAQTGNWYIDFNWWWWRSSRVLSDVDLAGNHREVIDEFPSFSYVLGDNHPHVLAMPVVLLVIGLLLNLFLQPRTVQPVVMAPVTGAEEDPLAPPWWRRMLRWLPTLFPLGWLGFALITVAVGSLVFLNTWDFPPYWLLLALCLVARLMFTGQNWGWTVQQAVLVAGAFSLAVVVGTVILYLPYFLTAQSQAGGFIPNLFHPTRLPQFVLMFGYGLAGVGALLTLAWPQIQPTRHQLVTSLTVIYGGPLLLLALMTILGVTTSAGRELLNRIVSLPEGSTSHLPFIIQRWSTQGFTFLLVGALLAVAVALLWQALTVQTGDETLEARRQSLVFALLLAGIGLLLVYAPEFVYLRDNFGWRMNTIFKFYYQGWLLFGLSSSYAIITSLGSASASTVTRGLAGLSALCIVLGLLFPVAAAYSKTAGFSTLNPTFDATAYIAQENPAEAAALAWVWANTAPDALIAQAVGFSYHADRSRVSGATGRPTLLGWNGHEGQWRGSAYGEMAHGREEALTLIYRSAPPAQISQLLAQWGIDYVYVGRVERAHYEMTPLSEERLAQVLDLVFAEGDVRIYGRRGR